MTDAVFDLAIIGGGVNGCGIARDAAGRGLSVFLAEKGDLASATSSASTKLLHGGLRYLEFYEFRLVREALREREVLLDAMPHIAKPMRFVLPHHPGLRPFWMLRLGLFLYDHLGGGSTLPGTRVIDLGRDPIGALLKPGLRRAFEYSDGWVDDARMVVLCARDAAERGAEIRTRTRVTRARRDREAGLWRLSLADVGPDGRETPAGEVRARALVNAAGPWVDSVIDEVLGLPHPDRLRLVRGSHIVVPRIGRDERALFLQGRDGRLVFVIPWEEDFTMIGTTEADHEGDPGTATCTEEERDYLCRFASEWLREPVRPEDVVWSFAGVRPLHDEGEGSATSASRDYVLRLDAEGPAVLHVFGGKITTHRRLAEAALARLAPHLPAMGGPWTARAPLPGGDFARGALPELVARLSARYPWLDARTVRRLARSYGTDAFAILGEAGAPEDLGEDFGAGLTEAELAWMAEREFARSAEDVLWRRSKLGLRVGPDAAERIGAWLARHARAA